MANDWARTGGAAVAGLLVGIAAGALVGPSASGDPEPPRAESGSAARVVTPGPTAAPCAEDERVAELEQDNARLAAELAEADKKLADEIHGVPPLWTDAVPELMAPAGFTAQVQRAVAACGLESDLVEVDCGEPPCLAVFRQNEPDFWSRFVNGCPEWADVYGSSVTSTTSKVDCGDGLQERVVMIGVSGMEDHVADPRPEDPRNGFKRLQTRAEDVVGAWRCATP